MELIKILEEEFALELHKYSYKLHLMSENSQDYTNVVTQAHELMHKIATHKQGLDILRDLLLTDHNTLRDEITYDKIKNILEI